MAFFPFKSTANYVLQHKLLLMVTIDKEHCFHHGKNQQRELKETNLKERETWSLRCPNLLSQAALSVTASVGAKRRHRNIRSGNSLSSSTCESSHQQCWGCVVHTLSQFLQPFQFDFTRSWTHQTPRKVNHELKSSFYKVLKCY